MLWLGKKKTTGVDWSAGFTDEDAAELGASRSTQPHGLHSCISKILTAPF